MTTPYDIPAKELIEEIAKTKMPDLNTNSLEEAVNYVSKIDNISNLKCRERVEKLFDSKVMAENYLAIYRELIQTPTSE